jgi:hypothetical protein
MKRIIYLIFTSIFLISCVNQSEYDKVKLENNKLKAELNEIKNGAEFRLNEIVANFNNKNYSKLKILVDSLKQLHPNSEQSKKAISLNEKVEKIVLEKEKKDEKERLLKEKNREKTQKEKLRQIIRIKKFYSSRPNSAGGVDFNIIWQNKSNKIVKYVTFEVVPYNAVGDVVECTIRNSSIFRGQVTGPIKKNKWNGYGTTWSNAWYNSTIKKIKVTEVDIDYVDGTSETLYSNDIKYVRY